MDVTKQPASASRVFKSIQDLASRVATVDYYLLAGGRDDDRAMPIRVSRNVLGHVIAAEVPDHTGEPFISNDTWIDVQNSPWIKQTDHAGYEAALQKIRDEAKDKIVMISGASFPSPKQ